MDALARIPDSVLSGRSAVGMASYGDDRGLAVEFFIEDVYQPFLSEKEGVARYLPVEMVRVRGAAAKGDFITRVFSPKPGPEDQDKSIRPGWDKRFPAQYAAFKAQQEQVPDGTPLEMCKFLPSHRVKELKARDVHTVEQYALMPDAVVQTLGMGAPREKKLCEQYLASDDQKVAQLSSVMAENRSMQQDMQMLKDQLAQLNAQMGNRMVSDPNSTFKPYQETVEAVTQKRGPGRPPKQQENPA